MKKFRNRTDKIKFLSQLENGASNILELAETKCEVWWCENEDNYHSKPFPECENDRLKEDYQERIVITADQFRQREKENPHIQFILVKYG